MGLEVKKSHLFVCSFTSWREGVTRLLDAARIVSVLARESRILIKPNLVEALPPPITTPVGLVEALIDYLTERLPAVKLVIGEGSGSRDYGTMHAFAVLGYKDLAERKGVELVDLNEAPLTRLARPGLSRWPEFHLPQLALESFLLSVPVLKAHTLAGVTLTMKNMMGLAPPLYYEQGGHWKKAAFHERIQEAILDLNRYRMADFTLLDATVGMARAHLFGPTCNPPPNMLVAGFDPVAVDAFGAALLNKNWEAIDHIRLADGELGSARPFQTVRLR